MPWVRLHSIKAYYDMPTLLSRFPQIKASFNLVPSLLVQLQEYISGQAEEDFLDITAKPASELTPEDKSFLLENFFNCNWETMIKPYPRYWQLLVKRGLGIGGVKTREVTPRFQEQDFRDLQVWFNLAWFGYSARKDPALGKLFQKGRFFTEAEKGLVLEKQKEIMREIIPLYARLARQKQLEITTSPFYHPILPLLVDSDIARRPLPAVRLPQGFRFPEDAKWQLEEALNLHESTFGQRPVGLWPSEGSVCPELIPIISGLGIQWTASDEGILFSSLGGRPSADALYYPYAAEHGGARVNMVFRDHGLSDRIGFVYQRNPAQESAEDFISHLHRIRALWQPGNPPLLLTLVLDGENPWEYYRDGGEGFLTKVYQRLSDSRDFKTTTVSEYLAEFPPKALLNQLYSGSWINQNFDIWIGGSEENEAWNLLGQTRSFLATALGQGKDVPDEIRGKAWEAIHAAEGSDWFWWYGDHFSSAYSFEFDRLFRAQLSQVYTLLAAKAPDNLVSPIKKAMKVVPLREPVGFIHPVLDGRQTQFFEWSGAGFFETRPAGGAMYQEKQEISAIYYGFDVDNLYFRLDVDQESLLKWPQDKEIYLHFLDNCPYFLWFQPAIKGMGGYYRLCRGREDGQALVGEFNTLYVGNFIELAVSIRQLGFEVGEEIRFMAEIREKGLVQERQPAFGYLTIIIPDKDFEQIYWQV